jgi:hypothetical protein
MKLSLLLAQRDALLRHARVANLAFAYAKLSDFAARITRARLHGAVQLRQPMPDAGPGWLPLVALEGNPSVFEEHFTEEDLTDFADALAFVAGESPLDVTFRIEELADRFVTPLRRQLEQAGVDLDHAVSAAGEPHRGHASS